MILSLATCGGDSPNEAVTLVDVTTELGISLKLPSDMTKQSEVIYANMETGDVHRLGYQKLVYSQFLTGMGKLI